MSVQVPRGVIVPPPPPDPTANTDVHGELCAQTMRTYGVCVKKTQVYCTTAPPEVTTLLAWGHELVDDTCESEIVAYHRLFTVAAVGFIAGGALTIQTPVASAALYVI